MTLVLDGSVALAWCFEDETNARVDELMIDIAKHGAIAPAIWRLEVANGLRSALRRGRISLPTRNELLVALNDLDIETDFETHMHAWGPILGLADQHGLTPYDASYLELAVRRHLPLATLDKALAKAAGNSRIQTLGLAE